MGIYDCNSEYLLSEFYSIMLKILEKYLKYYVKVSGNSERKSR